MQLRNSSSCASGSKLPITNPTTLSLSSTTRGQEVSGFTYASAIECDTGATNCSCPGFKLSEFAATMLVADSSSSLNSPMDTGYLSAPRPAQRYLDVEILASSL